MERNEIRSFVIGIAVTTYMVIAYDTFQDAIKNGVNFITLGTNVAAGVGSLGIGLLVFFLLIFKKK